MSRSNSIIGNVTLLGGTGFVGTQLTVDLAKHFDQVTVLTRHKQRCRDLQVLTNVDIQECDVHNEDALAEALKDANVVINLVGILNQSHGSGEYLRSKGLAEQHVQTVLSGDTPTTIFRPSVIFGEEDSFFNRFATLLRAMPVFPLACPDARTNVVRQLQTAYSRSGHGTSKR